MSDPLSRSVNKIMAPLWRRVTNMLARGVLTALQDNGGLQMIQGTLFDGELADGMERFQEYGFTSCPPPGSEFVVLFLAGRSHPVVIAVDSRDHRVRDLANGDVALYSLGENMIHLQAEDGKIYITAPGNIIVKSDETLRLEGKQIEIHAEEKIKWDVAGRGYDYLPTKTNSFETGSVSGSTAPIAPPEHGGPPAN